VFYFIKRSFRCDTSDQPVPPHRIASRGNGDFPYARTLFNKTFDLARMDSAATAVEQVVRSTH
jgi:hypothetical protein